MIKLKPNLTEMALARHKKVVCRGISMSSLFLWPPVSQRNGLIQWYEQHVSVWTIIMVFSHIISSLQISTRYSISVPTYFLRSVVICKEEIMWLKTIIMVHTDMCCSYHCIKPFLCDTVGHRNRLDMLIPLHTTFLCCASAISVKFGFNFIMCHIK